MKTRLIAFATQKPRWVYLLTLVLVVACLGQFAKIRIDTDPENMLAADDVARQYHNSVKQQFALHDAIVVGVVAGEQQKIYTPAALATLHQLTSAILPLEQVIAADTMALSLVDNIRQSPTEPGTIRFDWLMKQPPATSQAAMAINTAVDRLPMLANTLVSEDGRAAAIYVPLEDKNASYRVAEQIRAMFPTLDNRGDLAFHITGLPVAEDQFGAEMFVQMAISAPLAGLMIFAMMWLFFRSAALITGPMLVAMATVIITMGLLIGFGFEVHILSSMIAIFLMPIAVVDSIHILSEFADHYRRGEDVKATLTRVVGDLYQPMLFTSLTSSVGFFSLMLTPIPPVRIFGGFVGTGILLAFFLTITLLPAYIVRLSPAALARLQSLHRQRQQRGRLTRWLASLGRLAIRRRGLILFGAAAVMLASILGISQITINDNPVRWFKADHPIRVADTVLNRHFAGTYNAYLVLDGSDNAKQRLGRQLHQLLQQINDAEGGPLPLSALDHQAPLVTLETWLTELDDLLFSGNPALETRVLRVIETLETLAGEQRIFLQPAMLGYLADLQQALEQHPEVGKINSLADIIRTVNRELHGGEDKAFVLPGSAEAAAQVLMQYQSSHRPDDLWHFVTPDHQTTLLWLQLRSGDNQSMTAVMEAVDDYTRQHPLPDGLQLRWAGKAYLNVVWQQQMVFGMLDSLLSAFVLVFVMMVLLFRSVLFGALAMLPLTLTITLIYGLIGWLGKDYDMPIAVLSSLTLGLSVDFAIHFIERFRAMPGGDPVQRLKRLFEEPARAISRNAIVIALGFTPLLLAPLVPYVTVGIFLASIMAISALVTLLLLPALLPLAHRHATPSANADHPTAKELP